MPDHPSEQDVRNYVEHHPLSRPHIPWLRIIIAVTAFEGVLLCSFIMFDLKAGQALLLADVCHFTILLVWGRHLLSLMVKVYQRYAPERVRRGCKCMPTCSEYALIALEKYIWPKALILIIRRVTITCDKPGYKIDYP